MREVKAQLDLGLAGGRAFDVVVHACGSGGTAAGVALGCALHGVARRGVAMAVCGDRKTVERRIASIVDEARAIVPGLPSDAPFEGDDPPRGPASAGLTDEQKALLVDVAR